MASSRKQYVPQDDGVQFVERFGEIDLALHDVKHSQDDLKNKVTTISWVFGILIWLLGTAAMGFGLYVVTNSLSLAISPTLAVFIWGLPTELVLVAGVLHRLSKST